MKTNLASSDNVEDQGEAATKVKTATGKTLGIKVDQETYDYLERVRWDHRKSMSKMGAWILSEWVRNDQA